MIFEDHSFNITPVASEYKEIHPYSVVNIDIVKINTTMMREWPILKKHDFMSKTWFSLIPDTRPEPEIFFNTRSVPD